MLEVVPVYWPLLALSLCFLAICIVLQRPASRLAQIGTPGTDELPLRTHLQRRGRYLYGWRTGENSCVAGCIPGDSLGEAQAILDRLQYPDLVILGTLNLPKAHHPDLLQFGSQKLGRVDQLPNVLLITFRPPNTKHLQLLSLQPIQLSEDGGVLQGEGNGTNKGMEEAMEQMLQLDFARSFASGQKGELPLRQMNAVYEVQSRMAELLQNGKTPKASKTGNGKIKTDPATHNRSFISKGKVLDLSVFAQQLATRAQQLYNVPSQILDLFNGSKGDAHSVRARYISFYGMLWLIANDIIIGRAVAKLALQRAPLLQASLHRYLSVYVITGLRDMLLELNDWPAGLKLNYELGKFFCDAFLWFLALWESALIGMRPHLPTVINLIAISGYFGLTFQLALLSDLLSLITLHVHVFYLGATALYSWHISVLYTLFNIFRGKKYNILRKRNEPAAYSLDQLLIGTILFTLASFLFPTVLAYYLLFAATRVAIILVHAGLETSLAFLNHFPLFALMLRVKDPHRLPGGVTFILKDDGTLQMKNKPVPFSALFIQWVNVARRVMQHYSPVDLLKRVLTGRIMRVVHLEMGQEGVT